MAPISFSFVDGSVTNRKIKNFQGRKDFFFFKEDKGKKYVGSERRKILMLHSK